LAVFDHACDALFSTGAESDLALLFKKVHRQTTGECTVTDGGLCEHVTPRGKERRGGQRRGSVPRDLRSYSATYKTQTPTQTLASAGQLAKGALQSQTAPTRRFGPAKFADRFTRRSTRRSLEHQRFDPNLSCPIFSRKRLIAETRAPPWPSLKLVPPFPLHGAQLWRPALNAAK
jgi:hypothetical protein